MPQNDDQCAAIEKVGDEIGPFKVVSHNHLYSSTLHHCVLVVRRYVTWRNVLAWVFGLTVTFLPEHLLWGYVPPFKQINHWCRTHMAATFGESHE